jgi:hypothetical protein
LENLAPTPPRVKIPLCSPPPDEAQELAALRAEALLSHKADLLGSYFLNRVDAVAVLPPWGYASPGRGELADLLRSHLSGAMARGEFRSRGEWRGTRQAWRLGSYAPSPDNLTRWICFDFDGGNDHKFPLQDALAEALRTIEAARALGLVAYLERSGGGAGWHVWIFFESPIAAAWARRLGMLVVPKDAPLAGGGLADVERAQGIELFPKQDEIPEDKFGNMVWLPWWHGAKPGGNEFYALREGEEGLEAGAPFVPADFVPTPIEVVRRALGEFCTSPAPRRRRTDDKAGPAVEPRDFTPQGLEELAEGLGAALRALPEVTGDVWRPLLGELLQRGVAPSLLPDLAAEIARRAGDKPRKRWGMARQKAEAFTSGEGRLERAGALKARYPSVLAALDGLLEPAEVLPARFREQWQEAERRAEEAGAPVSLAEGAEILKRALLEAEASGEVLVAVSPCGAGKSTVARAVAAELPGVTAVAAPMHDLAREWRDSLSEAGTPWARLFPGPAKRGLLDDSGERVCKVPLPVAEAVLSTGIASQKFCARCPHKAGCLASSGAEGASEPAVVLGTHAEPPTVDATARVWFDEMPALVETKQVEREALQALAAGCQSLGTFTRKVTAEAAQAVLDWLASPSTTDPLLGHRSDLRRLCDQGPHKAPRAQLNRATLPEDDYTPAGQRTAQRDGAAWGAARWLMAAALYDLPIRAQNGAPFYTLPTKAALVARGAPRVAILTATPGASAEALSEALGRPVRLVRIQIKEDATIERVWKPRAFGGRAALLPHGRPDWERLSTALADSLEGLRARPWVKRVLLGSLKPVAVAARLVAAHRQGETPNPADVDAWREICGVTAPAELKQAQAALAPLLGELEARGGRLEAAHYGAVRGLDGWKEFDAAIALGEQFPSLEEFEAAKEAAKAAGKPEPTFADYQAPVAAELEQFFGRLRAASRKAPAWLLCVGSVLPEGWSPPNARVDYRSKGRPAVEAGNRPGTEAAETWEPSVISISSRTSGESLQNAIAGSSPLSPLSLYSNLSTSAECAGTARNDSEKHNEQNDRFTLARLRELVERLGGVTRAAEATGTWKSSLSRWYRGERAAPPSMFYALEEALAARGEPEPPSTPAAPAPEEPKPRPHHHAPRQLPRPELAGNGVQVVNEEKQAGLPIGKSSHGSTSAGVIGASPPMVA